jgi:predicted Zn-dependent protease
VYWREAQAGQELNLATRMRVPLQLLSQEYPEFIPGHLRYAEVLVQQEQLDQALDVLEQATTLYPDQPELAQMRVRLLASAENWLEASIAARQFALLNPEGASATDFLALADQYQEKYRARLRNRLTGNTIANILTGTAGFLLTGNLYGPLTAVDSTVLLLRGESAVGESVAKQAQAALPLVEDEAIVAYVNQIGQKLVRVAGRDEFEYEFYVVNDPSLNAFALPGGKVFVNAGAIAKTESEAELAGLIAHELSHAVLSHGFQLVTGGNATANIFQFVPYAGGLATQIAVSSYSRDMERQADAMATRMLTAAGYAADGLYNLMGTLGQENTAASVEWLSSHPDTPERLRNIATQIEQNGYNRYTYEGVENHLQMRQRVLQFLPAQKESALPDNQ